MKKIQTIFRQEGLSAVARRALAKLLRVSGSRYEEAVARRKGSYRLDGNSNAIQLTPRLGAAALVGLTVEACIPQPMARHYLDHRFDLLGSGWVQVRYGMHCRGMAGYRYDMGEQVVPDSRGDWLAGRLNPSNLKTAQRIWQRVDRDCQLIDWQLDFKSGYRWSEKTWATRLTYGHLLGVDVKVPWELSRTQHLPQMALRAATRVVKDAEVQQLVRDIRNQWLDFIATNPPGFGVNWLCPMDIAIRAANWCLAWDILQAAGFMLDPEDENVLAHSLYDHGHYIVGHLEWLNHRANHYLADICGLAFIAAYLPETRETDRWLTFAIGQLHVETLRQFLPDGGNFEGSTAYHRLSTEMVLYTTALVLGLPQERLERLAAIDPKDYAYLPSGAGLPDRWTLHETGLNREGESIRTPFEPRFVERLQRAVSFFAAVLKQDGSFPQIGDNDSGRFFKLEPVYSVMTVEEAKQKFLNLDGYDELDDAIPYYFEDVLDGIHLLNTATALGLVDRHGAIRDRPILAREALEGKVVIGLSGGNALQRIDNPASTSETFADDAKQGHAFLRHWGGIETLSEAKVYTYPLPKQIDVSASRITVSGFENFGCYIFQHPDFYLSIRCCVEQETKIGGHSHDDQLSIELKIGDNHLIQDLGSFVYTALPGERIRYRSALAHFSPSHWLGSFDGKPAVFDSLFVQPAAIDFCGPFGFASHVKGADQRTDLLVRFESHTIKIMHITNSDTAHHVRADVQSVPYSPGYGIQERIPA
ncbi:heparinase II/III family protein [bacterium]|nr:heparinase II/III family protein [bacterium]